MTNFTQIGDGTTAKLGFLTLKRSDALQMLAEWTGTLTACLDVLPERGELFSDWGEFPHDSVLDSMRCTESTLVQTGGQTARVNATYQAGQPEEGLTEEPIGVPIFELEFSEKRKKIETHPLCGILTGVNGRLWANWTDLENVDYDPDPYLSGGVTSSGNLVWTLEEYKKLKKQGTDDYVTFHPKLRRTLLYVRYPANLGTACGQRQNPPIDAYTGVGGEGGIIVSAEAVDGWQWLAGVDRCVKSGTKYERTTEWTGVNYIDPLVYPDIAP